LFNNNKCGETHEVQVLRSLSGQVAQLLTWQGTQVLVRVLTTYPAGQGSGIHLLFNKTNPVRHLVQDFPSVHLEHLSTPHGLQTFFSSEKVPSGHEVKHF
jgi:hypothetical protein